MKSNFFSLDPHPQISNQIEAAGDAPLGPSIKYVTLFFANFYPSPPVTLCHTSRDPPKVGLRHTSRPPIFIRPSTKNPDKIRLLYKFSLNCSRGFLSGGFVFCLEGFVRGAFCPFPLLSECMCYNRKLHIT